MTGPDPSRGQELADNLAEVEQRVTAAAHAAGRSRSELTLVAVSKTWPLADLVVLRGLGVGDFGENRDQEAKGKAAGLTAARWHFVGAVQSNKAASVASYADVVHSVDRGSLLTALSRAATTGGRTLEVLLQVSLDGDTARGGALPSALPALALAAATAAGLRLAGVMAVAPRDADPARAFAELARLSAALVADHPQATVISAGMSGDLEQAVLAGATHLRVGSALFGHRTPVFR